MYKNIFDKNFINKIKEIYFRIDKSPNTDFFNNPSKWRTGLTLESKNEIGIDYFEEILFPPNFEIIEYMCENFEIFQNKTIMDYGCGVGTLSALLTKLGIDCYNYDDFSQINRKNEFFKEVNKNLKLNLREATDILPDVKFFAITCSGYWITDKIVKMKAEYLILDKRYEKKLNLSNYDYYNQIDEKQFLKIYKLKL